jgi:hypothetical protein
MEEGINRVQKVTKPMRRWDICKRLINKEDRICACRGEKYKKQ